MKACRFWVLEEESLLKDGELSETVSFLLL